MRSETIRLSVASLFLASTVAVAQDSAVSSIPLPTQEQQDYLRSEDATVARGPGPLVNTEYMVTSLPRDSIFFEILGPDRPVAQPLQSANELVILLDPTLTGPEIKAALAEYRLDPVHTLPEIGGVVVDTSRRLGVDSLFKSATSLSETKESVLGELSDLLAQDRRFLAVVPNSVISTFELRSVIDPVERPPGFAAAAERVDWGIAETHFDKIWPRMANPIKIGVVDVGFANHEDLDIVNAFAGQLSPADHGNHVAGIMCAKHNGLGVRGALKNCSVVASSGKLMLTGDARVEGDGVSPFTAQFSEYLATVLDFLNQRPDVRVINLSLGYNWMPNFNIDPRAANADKVRNEIRGQGRFFASVLALAKLKNVAFVMAAGNDSSTLATPLEAELASPFSFGSRLMERADGWTNGVIVEAYDSQHRRAKFSNVGGHIACPGVDILSTLASRQDAYGLMSGTSMASPYCAAGLAAVLALRPELNLRDAIDCMRSSPTRIGGVPVLDVERAVTACKLPQDATMARNR